MNGQTLFISDLHLDETRPAATQLFIELTRGEARQADALYILGDLFEYWLGDDVETPLSRQVAQALSDLSASGTPCFFIHGNRGNAIAARRMRGQSLRPARVADARRPTMYR